jgi:hypothetical protein
MVEAVRMKEVSEITACVVDYGTFISLADRLSMDYKKVYYYSPNESEYRDVNECVLGDGLTREGHRIERIDEFITPEIIQETDLFIFPDIGWGGTQRYLRSIGKAVWGAMGADELELYRTRFLALMKKLDLPVVPFVKIVGLTALAEHLKTVKDKWIKVNVFRENMETWHHQDWDHSQRILEKLAVKFGGVKELPVFVVQDDIETDLEVGYDGWTVDGEYPDASFQGYEKKNELYLGAKMLYKDLPEEIRVVNDALKPTLKQYGYRNFIATEIRVANGKSHFIDPTMRLPGQTGEQLLETCSNLPEVIWKGANGELVKPKFQYEFAVEATLHYTDDSETCWRTMRVPKEIEKWVKLYHYCMVDGVYQFPSGKNDELGVLLGVGNTIEAAIDHLKKNLEALKHEPVAVKLEKMADLLEEAKEAKKHGIRFTEKVIPGPEVVRKQ